MIIFPAIDMRGGKAVRLFKGDYNQETVFYNEPYEAALRWQNEGAEFIHIVDLDGSKEGGLKNIDSLNEILKRVNVPVEFGGGVRNIDDVKQLFDIGVKRVILGTKALDSEFLSKAIELGEIAVSIDAENGFVKVGGWLKESGVRALDFAKQIKDFGVKYVVYTDISKDGTLQGPDFSTTIEISNLGLNTIASGGISSIDDLKKLKQADIYGAIVGKALYSGALTLKDIGDANAL